MSIAVKVKDGHLDCTLDCDVVDWRKGRITRRHQLLIVDKDGNEQWVGKGDRLTFQFTINFRPDA